MTDPLLAKIEQAQATGMLVALHAQIAPDRMAIESPAGRRSFAELNQAANQLARFIRRCGIQPGDGVAILLSNRPEFVEALCAALRCGVRITPINWHLTGGEVSYIVQDCEAKLLIAEPRFADAAKTAAADVGHGIQLLSAGGAIDGFNAYDAALEREEGGDITDPVLGRAMLYTSGTTGRPKGVYRTESPPPPRIQAQLTDTAAFNPETDTALVTGPLYHAAPLALNLQFPLFAGVGIVLMDRWDAEETLALMARHRITHTHVVPTMLHRMLALPDAVKDRYDLSALRWVLHGAAPCPVDTKKRSIDWLGPVLYEYYAATEGGGFYIDSHEWLKKPGSVGKNHPDLGVAILDDNKQPVNPGDIGTVYFEAPTVGRFTYFKDAAKTASAYHNDHYTMGDHGYLDEDDYLFLTGRSAEQIISGGVNIYPAEIDAVLVSHPAVGDVATIGVPNQEWGEEVKAVVEVRPGFAPGADLAEELISFCRQHLAAYKCPRSIDFQTDLPRLPTGKILRRQVRQAYWPEESRKT